MNPETNTVFDPTDPEDALLGEVQSLQETFENGDIDQPEYKKRWWALCGFTPEEGDEIDTAAQTLEVSLLFMIQHVQSIRFEGIESKLIPMLKIIANEAEQGGDAARRTIRHLESFSKQFERNK